MKRIAPVFPRRQDWPERLAELIEARREAEFAWGTHDCGMFAADAVVAITGADPLQEWRGAYDTEEGADAIIAGFGGYEAFMVSAFRAFGAPECPACLLQRGDVGLVRYGNNLSAAVSLGHCAAVPGISGLSFLAPRMFVRGWAI